MLPHYCQCRRHWLAGAFCCIYVCAHHEQAGIILLLALPLPCVPPALVIAATLLCDVLTLAFSVALTFPFVPANPSTRPRKRGASRHRPEYHGSGGAALATDVCSTFRSTFVMRSPLCTIIVLPERYLARGGALLYVYLPLCYLRHLPSTCALYFWALLWRFQWSSIFSPQCLVFGGPRC